MSTDDPARLAESFLELMDGQAGFRALGPHVETLRKALQRAVRVYRRAEKASSPPAIAAAEAEVDQCFKALFETAMAGVLASPA